MKNFITTKRDSKFDEIYALLIIKQLYHRAIDDIYKWESPDWKNSDNSFGIEVTRAQDEHIGYTYNVMTKYLGDAKNNIPAKLLRDFRGKTYFSGEKLLAVSDSKEPVNGNRHIQFLLKHLGIKLKKLNGPLFTICAQNYLFEFSIDFFAKQDELEFAEGIKRISSEYPHTFDNVIVHTYDSVLCFSPSGDFSTHAIQSQELANLASLYRNSSKWDKGTLFSDITKEVLNQK